MNLTKFAADLFLSVREWAQPAFDALSERIETLERHFSSELDTRLGEIKTLSEDDVRALVGPLIPEQKDVDVSELVKFLVDEIPNHIPEPIEGPQGEKGEAGERGETGEKGEPGESIDPEVVREMVAEAVKEAVSKMEKPKDGKDALQVEILPEIDPEKSYPPGTHALHDGGEWRSWQTTSGMKGWEPLRRGLVEVSSDIEEDGTIVVRTRMTGEEPQEVRRRVALPVHRGFWTDGTVAGLHEEYYYGGSSWRSLEDNNTSKPGPDNKIWVLVAKRGKDLR